MYIIRTYVRDIYRFLYMCIYTYTHMYKHEASLYIIMTGTQAPAVNVCA